MRGITSDALAQQPPLHECLAVSPPGRSDQAPIALRSHANIMKSEPHPSEVVAAIHQLRSGILHALTIVLIAIALCLAVDNNRVCQIGIVTCAAIAIFIVNKRPRPAKIITAIIEESERQWQKPAN